MKNKEVSHFSHPNLVIGELKSVGKKSNAEKLLKAKKLKATPDLWVEEEKRLAERSDDSPTAILNLVDQSAGSDAVEHFDPYLIAMTESGAGSLLLSTNASGVGAGASGVAAGAAGAAGAEGVVLVTSSATRDRSDVGVQESPTWANSQMVLFGGLGVGAVAAGLSGGGPASPPEPPPVIKAPSAPEVSEKTTHDLDDGRMTVIEAVSTSFRVKLPAAGSQSAIGDRVELKLGGVSFATPKFITLRDQDIENGYVDYEVTHADLGADGAKELTAQITSTAGQVGLASNVLRFMLDTSVSVDPLPVAQIPSAPTLKEQGSNDLTDSLMNATEAVTTSFRATLPTEGVLAVVGDRVELKLGGSSFATPKVITLTQSNIENGYVDYVVVHADLGADGAKALTAQTTDAAGKVGVPSNVLSFILDTKVAAVLIPDDPIPDVTAPPPPVPAAPVLAEQGSNDLVDNLMNATEAVSTTFRATLPTVGTLAVEGDRVELKLGGAAFATPKILTLSRGDITNGHVDFALTQAELGVDAAKALTAQVIDTAGNVGLESNIVAFTLDTIPPQLQLAVTNGIDLTLTYDEALNVANKAAASDFRVTVGGVPRSVTGVAVTGSIVKLTLRSAVYTGETVIVDYTDPTSNDDTRATQDVAGNDAASVTAISVLNQSTFNNQVQVTVVMGPLIATSNLSVELFTANGEFLQRLDDFNPNSLDVLDVGTYRGVIIGRLVPDSNATPDYFDEATRTGKDLDMQVYGTTVVEGENVRAQLNLNLISHVAYMKAVEANGGQDPLTKGYALTSTIVNSTNQAVADMFGLPGLHQNSPVVAVVDASGVVQSYNRYGEVLAALSGADRNLNGNQAVADALIAGINIDPQNFPAADYDQSVANLIDAGVTTVNAAWASAQTPYAVTSIVDSDLSSTAPFFVKASTSSDGEKIVLTYNKALNPDVAVHGQFTVTAGGAVQNISGVGVVGKTVELTMTNAIPGGQPLTVTYTDPTSSNDAYATQDLAGQDAAPLAPTSVSDATPPLAPLNLDLVVGSDSGRSATDNTTLDNTPTIVGTAEAGSTVRLYDSNGTILIGTAVATGGNWNITTSTLGEGLHSLTAKSTDAAGNTSQTSSALAITIDTTAPTAPAAPDLDSASDTGSSTTDNLTNITTPAVSGTAEAESAVTLYDTDGTTVLGSAVAAGGNWVITSSTLNSGAHNLTVKAVDVAGNVSNPSAGLVVTIDTTAPTLTVSTAAFSHDVGSSNTDFVTNVSAQAINGSVSANLQADELVQVSLDNGSTWTAAASTVGSSLWSLAGQTLTGSNTLQVKVTDTAGNCGSVYSQAYVLDTTPPGTSTASVSFSADSGGSSADFITYTSVQTISGTLSVNLVSGELVKVSLNNGASWSTASTSVGNNTWTLGGQTLASSDTLQVKVLDAAGNSGAVYSQAYVLDTAAPTAPASLDLTAATDTGLSPSDNITPITAPVLTGTAEAGSTVKLYDTNGTTVLGSATADNSGAWSITSATLSDGVHNLTAKATDVAGNTSAASAALDVHVDSTAPTAIAVNTNNVLTINTGVNSNVITLSATDASHVDYQLVSGNGTNDAGNVSFNIFGNDLRTNSTLPVGSYNIYVAATDAAGNVANQAFAVTVSVNSAPVITAPSAIGFTDTSVTDTFTNATGTLSASDAEGDLIAGYGILGGTSGSSVVGGTTYDVSKAGTYGTLYLKTADGAYVYVPNASAINALTATGSESFTVQATDNNSIAAATGVATISVNVSGANDAPSNVVLSSSSVNQSVGANASIGNLTTTDADTGQTYTYTLVSGAGDTHNSQFNISADGLRANDASAMVGGLYSARIRTTDGASSFDKVLIITVVDDLAPSTTASTVGLSADAGSSGIDLITKTAAQTLSGTVSANMVAGEVVEVSLDNGSTWTTASTSVGANTWSLANQTLTASDTLKVRVTDTAGNSSAALSQAYVLDTTAPTTTASAAAFSADTGSSGTDFITQTAAQTLSGTVSANMVAGEVVEVSLDNGSTWTTASTSVGSNTWSLAGQTLTASNTLKARVTDTAGNSSTAFNQAYVLDTTSPTADLSAATDDVGTVTGALLSGASTNDTSLALTGTCEPGSTLYVYNGSTLLGAATVSGTGWSYSATIADGTTYQFNVKETDTAGNTSSATANFTVLGDTTAPTAVFSAATDDVGTVTGALVSGASTNDTSLVLTGTCEAGSTVNVYNGATLLGAATVTGTGWSFAASIVDGTTYQFNIKETDTTGNTSAATANFTVVGDTTASPVSITSAASTNDATPLVSGTGATGDTITAVIAGATFSTVAAGGTWSLDTTSATPVSGTLNINANGNNSISVTSTDAAGNISAAATQTLVVDTTAPTTTIATAVFGADTGTSASDLVTKTAAQTISGTLSAALATDEVVKVSLNNGANWTNATASVGSTSWSLAGQTLSGSNTLQVKVADSAGNDGTIRSAAYVLDTVTPTAVLSSATDDYRLTTTTYSTLNGADFLTGDRSLLLVGTCEAGSIVKVYNDSTSTLLGTATVSGTTWSFVTSLTTINISYFLKAEETDLAGNISSLTGYLRVKLTTATTATPTVSITSAASTNDTTPMISGTVSDSVGGRITVVIAGATYQTTIASGTTWSIDTGTVAPVSGSLNIDANGNNSISVTYTNTYGNTSAAATQTLVLDTTPPAATVASLWMDNDSGISSTDFIIVNASRYSPVVRGTLTTALAAGESVRISKDGGTTWVTPTVSGTNFSYGPNGSWNFFGNDALRVQVRDQAGNANTVTRTVIVDNSGPSVTVVAGSIRFSTDSGPSGTDLYTNTSAQTISGTLSAALPADGWVQVSMNNGSTWTLADVVSGASWSLTGQSLLGAGTIQARVTDTAGNTTTAVSNTYSIRTSAPVITLSELSGVISDLTWESQATATFRVKLPSTGVLAVAGDVIELLLDSQSFASPKSVTLSAADITAGYVDVGVLRTDLGADGAKSITAKISDLSGNIGTVSTSFTLDGAMVGLAEYGTTYISDGVLKISEVTNATTPVTFRLSLPTTGSVVVGDTVELLLGGAPLLPALKSNVITSGDIAAGYVDFGVSIADLGPDTSKTLSARVLDGSLTDRLIGTSSLSFSVESFASLNLAAVYTGTGGYAITGPTSSGLGEYLLSASGDINGDGLSDVILGSRGGGGVYVAFGRSTPGGNISSVDLANGIGGFKINVSNGKSADIVGDINGDGLADMIVGDTTSAYVVFGKNTTSQVSTTDLNSGIGGYAINGFGSYVIPGPNTVYDLPAYSSFKSAGDVNGDGIQDVLIGASGKKVDGVTSVGGVYVVYGKSDTSAISISQIEQATGVGGFYIKGTVSGLAQWGVFASGIGDVNGDGLADLAIGSGTTNIQVIYGKSNTTMVDLASVSSSSGFTITRDGNSSTFVEVMGAGDFNGDGFSDLVVWEPQLAKSYLIFGNASGSTISLASLTSGLSSQGLLLGSSTHVSMVGDINGDGLSDVWMSASGAESYVIFGRTSTANISLADLTAGTGGFKITGAGFATTDSTATASDVNGDGLMDLVIGTEGLGGTTASNCLGGAYVVFGTLYGSWARTNVDIMGDASDNSINDSGTAKTIIGGLGNDELTATAASVLYGGAGNDTFVIDGTMITALQSAYGAGGNTNQLSRIDGGSGQDTLELSGSGLTLDFTSITQSVMTPMSDGRIQNLEVIDLTGTGNNTVKLTTKDVLDLSSFNAIDAVNNLGRLQMKITGDAGDTLDLADGTGTTGWSLGNDVTLSDGITYHVWNSDTTTATLYVNATVTVI